MKKQAILLALAAAIFTTACKKSTVDDTDDTIIVAPVSSVLEVSTDITTNTNWSADKIYLLKGIINVTSGATLTIQPGTLIKGDKATKGTLVINRGGKIEAVGTVDKPIVFTSNQAVGARSTSDWGGIVLLGKAPNNQGTSQGIEGILTDAAGKASFGGTDPADNSGTLKYVRIEFGGIPLTPDNEINGLTFGSVGSGTTIDYVQVSFAGDDAYEWFGGSVNCKHLISIGALDDDFDADFGYSGKVQFAVAQRYPTIADVSGSNGFETDNDGSGSVKVPQTNAVFSNVTVLGPLTSTSLSGVNANYQHAAQIRRNSSLSILNSIFAGYTEGVYIDDSKVAVAKATSANYLAGNLAFQNNIVYGSNAKSNELKGENKADFETSIRAANIFDGAKFGEVLMNDPYKYASNLVAAAKAGRPNFTVKAGSVAETGALFSNTKVADAFFEKVTYRGAFGSSDWTATWANFDPQAMPYDAPGKVN
ncbi:hypothetical protein [Daejeonella oryzae]|uniref:hypothetical protein n=1 Tax=Daejeonella oryzae TaxID=1122943 RepID=UPI000408C491|nr:hypothetical protein [Daejeonella oryzae]